MEKGIPYQPIVGKTDNNDSKMAHKEDAYLLVRRLDVLLDSQNLHTTTKWQPVWRIYLYHLEIGGECNKSALVTYV